MLMPFSEIRRPGGGLGFGWGEKERYQGFGHLVVEVLFDI